MARGWSVIILILLASTGYAQTLVDAPSHISRVDSVLTAVTVASIGADAYATHLNWTARAGLGRNEVNPFARMFVSHGTAPLVAYFAAGAGTVVLANYKLGRRHRKLVMAFDLGLLGSEIYWTQYSLNHHIN